MKLKILGYVGQWTPGQIIDVDEKTADQLLIKNEYHNGYKTVVSQRAMKIEEALELEAQMADINDLTAGEAAQLGIKNIVDSSTPITAETVDTIKKAKRK
jgi:hypothetical protein